MPSGRNRREHCVVSTSRNTNAQASPSPHDKQLRLVEDDTAALR
jgi:hypothetical protein